MAIRGATRPLFVIGDPIGCASVRGLINAKRSEGGAAAAIAFAVAGCIRGGRCASRSWI